MSKDSFLRPDLDNLLEGFQIIGFDWKYLYLNNIALIQSRLQKEELIGKRFDEVWPGIKETELYRLIKDCLEKRTAHHLENEFAYTDQSLGWFDLSIQPVPDGALVLSIDRSRSKLAEKERIEASDALRLNEDKYRYMFANNPQPMWIYDLETLSFLEVNDAAVANYGYSKEEFLSMTLKDIRPSEDVDVLLKDVAETKKTYNSAGVWRHLKKNKEIMFVEIISHTVNFNGREARHVIVNNVTSGKKVEDELRKSEVLFNKAFHGSPSPIAITSRPDRKYIAVNDSFLRLTGFTREEMIGRTGSEIGLFKTEDTAKLRADLDEKGKLLDIEILARSKSGKSINLLLSSQNTELAGIPCSISTMIDITERKRTEEALTESETKFRKIYEEGPFGMTMVNNEFRFLAANNTFCKITGYTEEELQKLTFKDISITEYVENDIKSVTMLINGEISVYKTEKRYIRKDGLIIWGSLTVTSNYNKDGQFLYNLAILEDITGRKQAEEDLRENRAYLNAALASMTDAVFISNLKGDFIEFNDAFATFHRFRNKGECSRTLAEYPDFLDVYFSNGEIAPLDMWAVPRALRGEIATNEEYILQRKDTGERWIGSYSFSPIRDENGVIFGSVVVGRDITDRKRAEKEIKELNETLEERVEERTSQLSSVNKELEAFSYSVSHDLRAPLRSISGFTQILMEEYGSKLDQEANRLCSIIQENSIKMGTLIDDLLAFSRLNRTELKKSVVQMKEMVSLVYEDLTDEVSVKRIEFNLGDICNSSGDPKLIKQVWINLISNAIKYSSKKEKAIITIGCKKEDGHCVYYIRDNGVGFDMAYVDKLFGVFQRLHGQKEFEGIGVGLAIVQRIVQRHGGKAWASGEVDKGAEFYFSIPIVTDQQN